MAEFTAPIEDRRSLTIRLVVLQVGCAVVFTILAFSFWYFQVVQNEKFRELAENNHQRTIALRAPRGVMLDRNGAVLVENRSSFTISIVREHTKDLDRTVRVLSEVAGLDPKYVQDIVNRHRREPTYRPIVIVDDASLAQVAAVLARRLEPSCPTCRSMKCRRGSTPRIHLPRTCSDMSARRAKGRSRAMACTAARSSGRPASRRSTTSC